MSHTHRYSTLVLFVTLAAASAPVRATQAPAASQQEHTERPRDEWQRVPDVLTALGAVPGAHVADVGAGQGWFTTRISKAVGTTGRVYAVDVNPISLRELKTALGTDYPNVEVVRGDEDNPRLPAAQLDAILVVNAYHEFAEFAAMLAHFKAALKPGGRLVLIEPLPRATETTRAAQAKRHAIAVEFVEADLQDAGFDIVRIDREFVSRPAHQDGTAAQPVAPKSTDWLMVARRR